MKLGGLKELQLPHSNLHRGMYILGLLILQHRFEHWKRPEAKEA